MHIEVNTDANIQGTEELTTKTREQVTSYLARFESRITRVEVHLSDQNSDKKVGKDAMRCLLEARLMNHQPVVVSHDAQVLELAVDGAAEKLARALDGVVDRLSKR